jgi:Fe-S-cluster containining protein
MTHRDRRGRVHLALLRDPSTGDEQVVLRSPLFRDEWQNELAAGTASTSRATLGVEPTADATAGLARQVMGAVSRLVAGLLARAPEGSVACRAGCDHCCYQAVSVTLPEALAIMRHLQATLRDEELAPLASRLAEARERTRGLTPDERFSLAHPCPFLSVADGRCTIYEVRPLTCRGMNSLDAGECARRLRDEDARAAFLASGEGSRSFLEPIQAVHAVSAGLQVALKELYGLDMRPLDLTGIMHLLLGATGQPDDGTASLAAWLRGDTPFEGAMRVTVGRDAGP